MQVPRSCGVIVFRREPDLSFLVMKHRDRLDLPKGHVDPGETDVGCALRELVEETGLGPDVVHLDPDFQFETRYHVRAKRYGEVKESTVEKTVVIFLGWLTRDVPVVLTEHVGYEWMQWNPPHRLGQGTLDGVLAALEPVLARAADRG
jgi:8-oxo-dGTP pyrophosphatase MutT (NUDIX family)